MTPGGRLSAVVFDLGGVLVDWDPRHLYRRLLPGERAVEEFLTEIGFEEWNHAMDAGQGTWAAAVERLSREFPARRELIAAYPQRFAETLAGPIQGTVAILDELSATGRVRLVALTNWAAETFAVAEPLMPFLDRFEGVLVSGREGVAKPDPAIFELLLARFGLDRAATFVVDDRQVNVTAATAAGLRAHLFTSPPGLRRELTSLGLLPSGAPG